MEKSRHKTLGVYLMELHLVSTTLQSWIHWLQCRHEDVGSTPRTQEETVRVVLCACNPTLGGKGLGLNSQPAYLASSWPGRAPVSKTMFLVPEKGASKVEKDAWDADGLSPVLIGPVTKLCQLSKKQAGWGEQGCWGHWRVKDVYSRESRHCWDTHTYTAKEKWVAAQGGFCDFLGPGDHQMDPRNSGEVEWLLGFRSVPDHWPKSPSSRVEFKTEPTLDLWSPLLGALKLLGLLSFILAICITWMIFLLSS